MPLETIGSYALAGSSGAVTRSTRSAAADFPNAAFAASQARGGKSGGNIELPSPAPNVAAYISPFIRLDLQTRLAIVEFRDSESGRVVQQYPSPRVVREYQQNLPETSVLPQSEDQPESDDGSQAVIGREKAAQTGESAPLGASSSDSGDPPPAAPAAPSVVSAAAAAFTPSRTAVPAGRELAVA